MDHIQRKGGRGKKAAETLSNISIDQLPLLGRAESQNCRDASGEDADGDWERHPKSEEKRKMVLLWTVALASNMILGRTSALLSGDGLHTPCCVTHSGLSSLNPSIPWGLSGVWSSGSNCPVRADTSDTENPEAKLASH